MAEVDYMQIAYEYVNEYEIKIINNPNFKYGDFDAQLERIFKECTVYIKENSKFYRSRIYVLDDGFKKSKLKKTKNSFNGYSKEESFVKLKNIKVNRMNSRNEPCLYVSSDREVTLFEIDAGNDDFVSVAEIKNNETLKIADLSQLSSMSDNKCYCCLSLQIQHRISKNYSDNKYYFPRYIASLCKKIGYDGIAFRSKYSTIGEARDNKGINYAIFNYRKCHAINSNVYSIAKRKIHLFDDYKEETVKLVNSKINDSVFY